MQNVAINDVKTAVKQYIDGEIVVGVLQNNLANWSWNVSKSTQPLIYQLIMDINLRFAERDAGHLPQEKFVQELTRLIS